jgi:hypothetical protein
MTPVARLHGLLALRSMRERQAHQAWARQADVCADRQRQLQALTEEHRLELERAHARDAVRSAALLGRTVDQQQVQRYQAGVAEGIELDQHFTRQAVALDNAHAEAQACLGVLRQQRALRQRQCAGLRHLCERAHRQAQLCLEWSAELEAEDFPGPRARE